MALPASAIQYQEEHINETKKPNLIAASAICLSAAYVAVALRFVARRIARNALGADDYTIVVALFFTSVFVASVCVCVHYGLGRHLILVTDGAAFGKVVYIPSSIVKSLILTHIDLPVHSRGGNPLQPRHRNNQTFHNPTLPPPLPNPKLRDRPLVCHGLCRSLQYNGSHGQSAPMFAHPRGLEP